MAVKKIYPALWRLFRDDFLPSYTLFLGYDWMDIDKESFFSDIRSNFIQVDADDEKFKEFFERNTLLWGNYEKSEFEELDNKILEISTNHFKWPILATDKAIQLNRIFFISNMPYATLINVIAELQNYKTDK